MLTDIRMVAGIAGSGKQITLDTPVLTPNGWVLNRDLQVGDYVISQDGKPTKVLEIYDNPSLNTYELTFSDGTSIECCEDHLWSVWNNSMLHLNKEPIVLSLKDMLSHIPDAKSLVANVRSNNYYSIPLVDPVEFNEKKVPIDPYILGFLIMKNKLITSKVTSDLVEPLQELGLVGCDNRTKFIPDIYLYNSLAVRKELLAGLLDCSAIVRTRDNSRNVNCLHTTSTKFASNFVELIRGLGGVINTPNLATSSYVKKISCGFSQLPFNPYKDPFKQKMFDQYPSKVKRVKKIKSATFVGVKPGRCIVVDNPSHLYVVKDYIVTHNSYKLKNEVKSNRLYLTASTGIASVNLDEYACTIHSLIKALEPSDILKSVVNGRIYKIFHSLFEMDYSGIAIDEAPMLSREYIDALITAMDMYGDKFNRQLELYLTGDIAQLAPISGAPYFKSKYISRFKTEWLTTIYRQTDVNFKDALNDLRVGKTSKIKELLVANNCFTKEIESDFLGLTLFSTKAKVEAYNIARLRSITGYDEFVYRGSKSGKVDSSWNMFLEPVTLKVGSLVRCITNINSVEGHQVANGDMAIVQELYKNSVVISLLRNDKTVLIKSITKKILNPETKLEEGSITYMPLRLSFACTVHSIQGITTDSLQIGMSRNDKFMGRCSGMAYVALSRNTNIEGIKVIGDVSEFDSCCYIDPEYLRFINNGSNNK